jgi:glycosyltransferase involved in cell wall biosynthesis
MPIELDPMKLAYLINYYPDFSHIFIRREIRALERQGIEVQRFALRGWDVDVVDNEDAREKEITRYLLIGGIAGLFLPTLRMLLKRPVNYLKTLLLALRLGRKADQSYLYHMVYLAEACKFLELCEASGATHVHAHFGTNPAEIALLTRSLGGPPYSFTVHGPEEFDKPGPLHLAEKIEHSKFVVAVSSFGRSQLFRCVHHEHWSKIREVHCGLDKDFYKDPPQVPLSKTQFVCVGRLCEQKGQLLFVEAVKLLRDKGVNINLVLAGDGEMRATVESMISAYGLQENIRITGWIPNQQVREEILNSRALALPSFAEGLPSVIMEAMVLRRPVLTTYIAGIPELVIDKQHGWLFPAGSVEALVEAIEQCLNADDGELMKMGDAGHLRVAERHDIDTESVKLAALFRETVI